MLLKIPDYVTTSFSIDTTIASEVSTGFPWLDTLEQYVSKIVLAYAFFIKGPMSDLIGLIKFGLLFIFSNLN